MISHGWLGDRKIIRPVKAVPLIPRGSLSELVDRGGRGVEGRNQLTQVHLENMEMMMERMNYYYYIRLTAFFQGNLGKLAPER